MSSQQSYAQNTSWQQRTKPTTLAKSATFMKKLVAMSISHIIYLRGLMPEHAFEDRDFDGVCVKILSESSSFRPAKQIIAWLKGSFEAFDKKYLEKLEFLIFKGEEPTINIHESYAFHFTYDDGSVTVNCENNNEKSTMKMKMDNVRLCTVKLLRSTSMVLRSMNEYQFPITMRVRLYYYDAVTPEDYEPPGFQRAPDTEFVFQERAQNITHGAVNTGYHTMTMKSKIAKSCFRSGIHRFEGDEENKENEENHASESVAIEVEGDDPTEQRSSGERSPESSSSDEEPTPTDVQHAPVQCACGNDHDGGSLIFCDFCRNWNHAICYRLTDDESVPSPFCCVFCHNSKPGVTCDDATLVTLSKEQRQILCLYRRALMFCVSAWRIDRSILMSELSVPENVADRMLLFMDKDNLFSDRGRREGSFLHINTAKLKNNLLPKYITQGCVDLPDIEEKNDNETNPSSMKRMKELSVSEISTPRGDNISNQAGGKHDKPSLKRLSLQMQSDKEEVKKTKKKFGGHSINVLEIEPSTSYFKIGKRI